MPKLPLVPEEYILDENFKKHGAVPAFLFHVVLPAGSIATLFLILKFALPAFSSLRTNPTLKDIKVYRIVSYAYIPLLLLLTAACLYYFANLFMEKLVLTNKAIIEKGVFSNIRVAYADIKGIDLKKGSFNSINAQRQWAWFIKNIFGINNIVEIETKDGKLITISNLAFFNALRLSETISTHLPAGRLDD